MSKLFYLVLIAFALFSCTENVEKTPFVEEFTSPHQSQYIGAQKCKECHEAEFNEWKGSDHFYAMQHATEEYVKGNFDTPFFADSISYVFSNSNGEYFVEVKEVGVPAREFKIEYTFGWHPLQQYLVSTENGKLQTLRASWDTEKNVWFHQYPGDFFEPHDWLSWSKGGQNWNTMCSSCHSTHLTKNYNEQADSFSTKYEDITVSCEACHGSGLMHQKFHTKKTDKDPYKNMDFITPKTQVNSCGGCHARRTMLTDISDPFPKMLDQYVVQKLTNEFYEPDGQIREEDYVYGSFLSSKMYRHNVTCTNCHNPHTAKLKMQGNDLCLQCHDSKKYNEESHTHHPKQSDGALCVNCHMDGKFYMGNDYRRDHSFRIPRPDQTVKYGTSNACNSCHTDKNANWAEGFVKSWYGEKRTYHFSDDLLPGSLINDQSFSHLKQLILNDSVNDIIRATAILYLGQLNQPEANQLIVSSLYDHNELVRQSAYSLLIHFPNDIKIQHGLNGLKDEFKGVRIMAFRSVVQLNPQDLKPENSKTWNTVLAEYEVYLKTNADFPTGQILLGEYFQQTSQTKKSEQAYLRALKMDSIQLTAYTNLAIIYSSKGDFVYVKDILEKGISHFPEIAELYYYLGLNASENGNKKIQIQNLKRAFELEPKNTSYAYNYILSLYTLGEKNEAIRELNYALKSNPESTRLISLKQYFESESVAR